MLFDLLVESALWVALLKILRALQISVSVLWESTFLCIKRVAHSIFSISSIRLNIGLDRKTRRNLSKTREGTAGQFISVLFKAV